MSLEQAVSDADLVALLVAHSVFLELEPGYLAALTPARVLVDAVNGWSSPNWIAAGFRLVRLGDGRQSRIVTS